MTKTIQEQTKKLANLFQVEGSKQEQLIHAVLQEVHTQAVEEERKNMLTILSKLRDVDGDYRLKMVQEFMDNIYVSTPSLTNKQNV